MRPKIDQRAVEQQTSTCFRTYGTSSRVGAILFLGGTLMMGPATQAAVPRSDRSSTDSAGTVRKALLIANARYEASGASLDNPIRDAKRIEEALKRVGFDRRVQMVSNLNRRGLKDAVHNFAQSLGAGDEAFVYYSGHGVAIDGKNYLLGVEFDENNAVDALYGDVYAVNQLIRQVESTPAAVRVVVVDACRNEPFTRSWTRSVGDSARGFAPVARTPTAEGTLVAFAARGQQQALDRVPGVAGGPYAFALAKLLVKPGLEVMHLFGDVRTEVKGLTGGRQTPEFVSRIEGRYYFREASSRRPPADSSPSVAPLLARRQPRILAAPPWQYTLRKKVRAPQKARPKLSVLSRKRNKITDDQAWFKEYGVSLPELQVPNPVRNIAGHLPDYVPTALGNRRIVKAIAHADHTIFIYGLNFASGDVVLVLRDETDVVAYLDVSSYRYAPKIKTGDESFVEQSVNWAEVQNNVLYIATGHRTYAASSGGMNAYITALDLKTGELLWRSAPLVANSRNFVLRDGWILSGYGFTAEPDYMYILNQRTGEVALKTKVKTAPEFIIDVGHRLLVRTYNTNYEFSLSRWPSKKK